MQVDPKSTEDTQPSPLTTAPDDEPDEELPTTEFITHQERLFQKVGDDAPALIINPGATNDALLAAARARSQRLWALLDVWGRTQEDEKLATVAESLAPLAEEVLVLLDALDVGLVQREEKRHG